MKRPFSEDEEEINDERIRNKKRKAFFGNLRKNNHDNSKNKDKTVKNANGILNSEFRTSLPIYQVKNYLMDVVKQHQVVVIEGEAGSGKTTQIPQYLYEKHFCENNMKIGCTQPYRVAAMSASARVAQEMNVKLGDEVGYSVRFENRISDKTIIKYMTDGMLLREFLIDPIMSAYSVLIIDEAHERTVQTDVIFGLLREVLKKRNDLKVIISSAPCDTETFSEYFEAPIFNIPCLRLPVETYYEEQEADYVYAAVMKVFQIHFEQSGGDVLVFLADEEEIERALNEIQHLIETMRIETGELIVLPIYSSLSIEEQVNIFSPTPSGARKVVLATNIAETSLTIDGIKFVVDCGHCKQKRFESEFGMNSLNVIKISRASAIQRACRAGRVTPGICFRLYKKCTFDEEFQDHAIPEIQRTHFPNVVLLMLSFGDTDVFTFPFMDRPDDWVIENALQELCILGAIDQSMGLTVVGKKMVEIPCDPMISKMILSSEKYACSEEIIIIAAMLSLDNEIFYIPERMKSLALQAQRKFLHEDGDFLTLLNVYHAYVQSKFSSEWCKENYIKLRSMEVARNIHDQLIELAGRLKLELKSSPDNVLNIRKAITEGFVVNYAQLNGNYYLNARTDEIVYMHPTSAFLFYDDYPRYIVYNTIVKTEKRFMRNCLKTSPRWVTNA